MQKGTKNKTGPRKKSLILRNKEEFSHSCGNQELTDNQSWILVANIAVCAKNTDMYQELNQQGKFGAELPN